jgi:hypothetical protein
MPALLRAIAQRQQHMAYFVICLLLFALALALAKPAGWWAIIAFWIALVGILELVYRWMIAMGRRNRQKWWARQRSRHYGFVIRWVLYLAIVTVVLMVRHPFLRYGLLALVAAGLLCAGIIRWLGHRNAA